MCLIVFHWQPGKQLVVAANRDEFLQRPAAPFSQWQDAPHIYAGRDLSQNGTWLGINQQRDFAALTNVRVFNTGPSNPPSRGELVKQFLSRNSQSAQQWANSLLAKAANYAPFNLLVCDNQELWCISNYPEPSAIKVSAGTHVLSNAQLNTPWPKAQLACEQLNQWLSQPQNSLELAQLLSRKEVYPDEQLPSTGVSLEMERLLSAQFILAPGYGTRCSTGVIINAKEAQITELTWDAEGQQSNCISANI